MSIIIGLTGPTGSGKSSAALIAKNLKIKIVDCDKVARKAVKRGSDGLEALCNAFGRCILKSDGTLNRKELARRAFSSKENTELLNKTLLPYIAKLVKADINAPVVLLDAPTLFESGLQDICDTTVAVLADSEKRMKRIIARDNLSREDAIIRMNAGKSDEYYIEKADFVVYNNGNTKTFKKEIQTIFSEYTEVKL